MQQGKKNEIEDERNHLQVFKKDSFENVRINGF